MKINIAIIGAGELGSRHLQSLTSLSGEINLFVVDPNRQSLEIANARFIECRNTFEGRVCFLERALDIVVPIDIAIIATRSKIRRAVIEELLNCTRVDFLILEKVLFTKLDDYDEIDELLASKQVRTWVNCPRRLQPLYQYLKSELGSTPMHLQVVGNGWDLGCNAVHFIDLFCFLSNQSEFILDTEQMDQEILKSKREGYIEFTGTLKGNSIGKNDFVLTCHKVGRSPVTLFIDTQVARYLIREDGNKAFLYSSKESDDWKWKERDFPMYFQSQLTHLSITELLEKGYCSLTPYSESMKMHKILIKELLNFQSLIEKRTLTECQIT